jgi:Domain of unknown function (DU1801)
MTLRSSFNHAETCIGRIEMKPTRATSSKPANAERQLKSFIAKFDPAHQTLIRSVRRTLRRQFPTAYELAYDNYNFFVIGYGPTERPSDCIVSMAAGANGVGLCFIHGASLPDPKKLLLGSGNQTRFIRLESADVLGRPEVETLIAAAVAQAKTPFRAGERGKLIIRSVSKKQRPRRRSPK